jgi:molybdenum cofactor cytidylyltransferase
LRPQTVDIKESAGRILCCTIFRPGGRKLLAKGHVLNAEDVRLLQTEGMDQVWVTELEDGEVGEDQAVSLASAEMGCGSLEIRLAAGGRANLFATEDCCVLVDDELLRQINCTSSIAIATNLNFSYAKAGQRIATVKSTPFAVPREQMEAVLGILRERGPIFQARPVRTPVIAVLYTDPVNGERARQLFEPILNQRLERFGTAPSLALAALEDEEPVARSLEHLLRARPAFVLIASTTAPAGPEDAVGRAMTRIGCHIERFLAPVEPGNLLLLGYRDEIPVVSAPGCYRSVKPNVVDLLLPPLLSRYRISGWEIACMGHGGLLGCS